MYELTVPHASEAGVGSGRVAWPVVAVRVAGVVKLAGLGAAATMLRRRGRMALIVDRGQQDALGLRSRSDG